MNRIEIETDQERETRLWSDMHDAERRAETAWSDPSATYQQYASAAWEAECARQQWSDAADARPR